MPLSRRTLLPLAAATALAPRVFAQTGAQTGYPTRPVRIVTPFPPGGALDATARKLAQLLSEQLGRTFFVENRTGATGTIGMGEAARAAPDGHTLLAMDSTYPMVAAVFRKLSWDHGRAFTPISDGAWMPSVLVVRSDSVIASYQDLLDRARREPEKISYGSGGNGSVLHFYTELFQHQAGVRLFHVPYRGAGDAMIGLLSGHVDLAIAPTAATIEHVRAGKMRALALTGPKRSTFLPDVPTFGEVGLPQFSPVYRAGLAAPAGTPAEIIDLLYREVKKAQTQQDMKDFLVSQVAEPGGSSPAEFAAQLAAEAKLWLQVAEQSGMEKQ